MSSFNLFDIQEVLSSKGLAPAPAASTAAASSLAAAAAGSPFAPTAVRAPGKSLAGGSGGSGKLVSLLLVDSSALARGPNSPERKCFSLIGQGVKFCVREACPIASHARSERFSAEAGNLYIMNNDNEAFCSPSLPSSRVTAEVLAAALSSEKSKEEWSTEFGLLDAQGRDSPMTSDGVAQRLTFLREAQAAKTPRKRPASDHDSLLNDIGRLDPRSELVEEFISEEMLPDTFVSRFREVDDAVVNLSTGVPVLLSSHSTRLGAQEEESDKLNVRLINVETTLGSPQASLEEVSATTVWGTVALLHGKLLDIEASVTQTMKKPRLDAGVRSELDGVQAELRRTYNQQCGTGREFKISTRTNIELAS